MVLTLGLDIGGSTTRARLSQDARVIAEASAGSASLAAAGPDAARAALETVLVELGRPRVTAAVAGAAGCDTEGERRRMRELLRNLLPGASIHVVHDARLVLAAAERDSGIALIAGTGSVAYGVGPSGEEARAGGWGHLLGDEGSGYWIVRTALRRVLADRDAGRPPSPLARRLLELANVADPLGLAGHFHRYREPAAWAACSHEVLAADQSLADAAASELAALAATVARRLQLAAAPVVLAGGLLLGEAPLERALRGRLAAALPGAVVLRERQPPVAGAVRLARRLAAGAL